MYLKIRKLYDNIYVTKPHSKQLPDATFGLGDVRILISILE